MPQTKKTSNTYLYQPKKPQAGITLIEILVCLAIVSILSFVVLPSVNGIFQNTKSNSNINQLNQLIRFARSEALAKQARVTFCPSSEGLHCEQDWHSGAMIFIDKNNNQERDEGETLLRLQIPFIKSGTITFNNPSNKIVFSRQGFSLGSAGSYIYCPQNNDEEYARALIINFQGRLRLGRDSNEDGIVEATYGRNVSCG